MKRLTNASAISEEDRCPTDTGYPVLRDARELLIAWLPQNVRSDDNAAPGEW
jgi:hypothetical protein